MVPGSILIEQTVSSGCPLSSPLPQWHVVLQQHDREFRAQRIMPTSHPQGSELYDSFPLLYWVRLQTHSWAGGRGGPAVGASEPGGAAPVLYAECFLPHPCFHQSRNWSFHFNLLPTIKAQISHPPGLFLSVLPRKGVTGLDCDMGSWLVKK